MNSGLIYVASPTAKRHILKALIDSSELAILPGIFDGFSTKLVEQAGFTGAFITGSGVAESRFVSPDVGLIALGESLPAAAVLAQHSNLAMIADADTGYGNAVNTFFTSRSFEEAGLAGILIEDQVWPKRCGHLAGKETIASDEMSMKVRAATDSRRDDNFVIMARTDAYATEGLASAIERGKAYAAEGADLLFADALLTEADIECFVKAVPAPVVVNMGFGIRSRSTTPLLSPRQLTDLGVSVAIYPRMLTGAAISGMVKALDVFTSTLGDELAPDRSELVASFDEIHEIIGLPAIAELEQRYEIPDLA